MKEPLHKYLTPEGERRVRVQDDGLASHTVFNLIERFRTTRWVEAELKTGARIRFVCIWQHIGLPIAGDTKYGDFALNKDLARTDANPSLKRMFLHAFRLKLVHPATGETLQVEAPLPAECRRFIEQLKQNY